MDRYTFYVIDVIVSFQENHFKCLIHLMQKLNLKYCYTFKNQTLNLE